MKKAIIIFFIAVAIVALWTFDHSFIVDSAIGRVSGTSAVVYAKTDDVSVRVRFSVIANPGTTATITFSNGTQRQVASASGPAYFNILFTKTSSSFDRSGGISAPAGILINLQKPFGAAILSNTTITDFASAFNSSVYDDIAVYWFKIEGKAAVTVNSFGVGI